MMQESTLTENPAAGGDRLQTFISSFPDILCLLTPEGFIANASRRFEEAVGCDLKALRGKGLVSFLHPDDRAIAGARIERASTSATEVTFSGRCRRDDGGWMWLEWNMKGDAATGGIVASARDVTTRVMAERELWLTQFTVEHMADAVYWVSPNSSIWDVNEAAVRMLGYSREEFLAMAVPDIDSNYHPERWIEHFANLKANGNLLFESTHRTKEGKLIPVEISVNYFDYHGREYSCAIVHDISVRKCAEEGLRQSEEQFRILCDSAPVGIFRSDGDGKCIYVNARWEEMSGLTAAESLGEGWTTVVHPDELGGLFEEWQRAVSVGGNFCHEYRLLNRDGRILWGRVVASPVKVGEGTISGYVGTVEDITATRKVRQELLRAQKLEALGVLAGGIAHDFNNILMALLTNLSIARRHLQDAEQVEQRLDAVEKAANRAADLTQQILAFSRGEEPVKRPIAIGMLAEEAIALAVHDGGVAIELALADDLWMVEADEGQISQVLHNLVGNAVHALPAGGTIRIDADNVRPPGDEKTFVRISVEDSGVGIPEENLERVFDPYFTTKELGNGIGLATCYSIVKRHGGSIHVESTLGAGTRFTVLLPATCR